MLAGDQHLATLVHHGVNEFRDAGVSFVSPSIVNYYVRWWDPLETSPNPIEGAVPDLGDYRDGFGNKITMLGYVNPDPDRVIMTGAPTATTGGRGPRGTGSCASTPTRARSRTRSGRAWSTRHSPTPSPTPASR
jgi:hypothetical protein